MNRYEMKSERYNRIIALAELINYNITENGCVGFAFDLRYVYNLPNEADYISAYIWDTLYENHKQVMDNSSLCIKHLSMIGEIN
uniref:Uncharacterized protein n=1 Tax=viral metagenome TaxID=1070528 RepID=A0A6H1ZLQ5_9ZZZZ